MPTVQELLNTINTTYRNTYSTKQKVEWMDTVQKQIYQKVPKEAPPYSFTTVSGFAFYALPSDCDRFGIKQFTIETKAGSGRYNTLDYLSIESTQNISPQAQFYSVLQNNFFINPIPTAETEGKNVYVIYNRRPETLDPNNLDATPDLEEDYHELLVLGVLERIARARGEVEDKNNFASDYNVLFRQYENMYKLRQPEYYKTIDKLPKQRRGRLRGSRNSVADLIPPGLR